MKLLLDANISWRLCRDLEDHFDEVRHVDTIGLDVPAKDREIWAWADQNNFLIVTNDEDFLDLIMLKGFPPKVLLLRTGNQSNQYIKNLLIEHKEDILSLSASVNFGILEIY